MHRQINAAGLKIIKDYEGLRLKAYPDPGTGNIPYTIGYGHTGGVKLSDVITLEQAEQFLRQDISSTEIAVDNFIHIPLTDNQFSALVSFAFNVGSWRSTPLFNLAAKGKLQEAAEKFHLYDHAGGKVMPGLTKRRKAEHDLFVKP